MEAFFELNAFFILFYLITVLWIGEFIIFPSSFDADDYREKRSFFRILGGVIASILFTITLTFFGVFTLEGTGADTLRVTGIIFYIIGILLRYSGSIYLGPYFTRNVSVGRTQELVSTGPYRMLRHPLYLGLFLLTVGVPLFFSNLFAIAVAFLIGIPLNIRMKNEEKAMENVLGDTYRTWKKTRYRFIPYIY